MKRLGSHPADMRNVQESDIFFSRLQLLVIMSKAFLTDCQLSGYRSGAVLSNVTRLSDVMTGWERYKAQFAGTAGQRLSPRLDHILFQRIKLLLVMGKSVAEGNPMGPRRRLALKNNVDYITDALDLENRALSIPVLSVA